MFGTAHPLPLSSQPFDVVVHLAPREALTDSGDPLAAAVHLSRNRRRFPDLAALPVWLEFQELN